MTNRRARQRAALLDAATLIERHGLFRESDPDDGVLRYCAVTALARTYGPDGGARAYRERRQIYRTLVHALELPLAAASPYPELDAVIAWNDASTQDDVSRALRDLADPR